MYQLAHYDVSRRFVRPRARIAAQLVFGLAASAAMIVVRSGIDLVAPAVGPFALAYPTILIATLYGHWRAGVVALGLSLLWAWYVVLPAPYAFTFLVPGDPARLALNFGCAAIVLAFAEGFRAAVERNVARLDDEVALAHVLHREVEHRSRNTFALIASLLEIQKRREVVPETVAALEQAIGRVHTFAEAFDHIAAASQGSKDVAMAQFLPAVIDRLARAAFGPNVAVHSAIAQIDLPRGVAVAVGLYINEALTNCAKYAFPDERPGAVEVTLVTRPGGWTLTVSDDGVGTERAKPARRGGGQGEGLLRAFAQQAGASHSRALSASGCHLRLTA